MVEQERIKLERKRARNRVAATRCRNRKLERIDRLQEQADQLRATNARLAAEVLRLRETVGRLRLDVQMHAGCQPAASELFSFGQ
jgi:predicted RNase H-like nuclease (RuvC/YqgF family)